MKILRYEDGGSARAGVVLGDGVVPLDQLSPGLRTVRELVEAGPTALEEIRGRLDGAIPTIALADAELLAPIERPGKYLAIGMNYGKHVAEADKLGIARSKYQTWFNKQTTCIAGPYDDIDPGVTEQLDHEVELGVVIGRMAKGVSRTEALDYIFGYFVANDVSARDWQFHSATTTMGKSFDTHGPIGPWIVTADEIPDPQALELRCFVNGEQRQGSSTANMIHPVAAQIEYLSTAFTLDPGDLITTGTPEGVGVGRDPQVFLKPGDVVRCEIDGIGAIENRVAAPRA